MVLKLLEYLDEWTDEHEWVVVVALILILGAFVVAPLGLLMLVLM